jgi:hypothetical protein
VIITSTPGLKIVRSFYVIPQFKTDQALETDAANQSVSPKFTRRQMLSSYDFW